MNAIIEACLEACREREIARLETMIDEAIVDVKTYDAVMTQLWRVLRWD